TPRPTCSMAFSGRAFTTGITGCRIPGKKHYLGQRHYTFQRVRSAHRAAHLSASMRGHFRSALRPRLALLVGGMLGPRTSEERGGGPMLAVAVRVRRLYVRRGRGGR